jgi:hypothetical protein
LQTYSEQLWAPKTQHLNPDEAPMLPQTYRIRPDSIGDRKGEYAHTTPRTPETTQYEHNFEVDKIIGLTKINIKRIV